MSLNIAAFEPSPQARSQEPKKESRTSPELDASGCWQRTRVKDSALCFEAFMPLKVQPPCR